jgi:hypothetical protein
VVAAGAAEPERAGAASGLDVGRFGADAERDGDLATARRACSESSNAWACRQMRLPCRSNCIAVTRSTASRRRVFADAVVAAGGFEFAVRHQLAQHLDGNAGVGVALGVAVPVGAKYHLGFVVIDLRNRGVRDILIACCDGLTGLPDAIRSIYPDTVVQTRVVHVIRNAMRFVSYKDRKKVASSMRAIYSAPTVDGAELALKEFDQQFGQQYPGAVDVWRNAWPEFVPFLDYPIELPKIVYTTNAIESINLQLRKITKNRGPFPDKDAAKPYDVAHREPARAGHARRPTHRSAASTRPTPARMPPPHRGQHTVDPPRPAHRLYARTSQHLPPTTTSTPLDCGPAWRSQVMNNPSAATPSCQCRPVRPHQRRNNAMPPAYDLVVNSEPSRPKSDMPQERVRFAPPLPDPHQAPSNTSPPTATSPETPAP